MEKDQQPVGELFQGMGITFTFSNLKNLASSNITYPQFLACVTQRLVLKQYAAQTMDTNNFLCPMSRTSDIFNKNKASFETGINDLFLKKSTLSVINSQTSKNRVTRDEQTVAANEFVKWYDSMWFNRLKSENFLQRLERAFNASELPEIDDDLNDWEKLAKMFEAVNDNAFFNNINIDSQVFINNADNIPPKWFEDILSDIDRFMKMTGTVDIPAFKNLITSQDLILPTTSSFMISTVYGIEEVEDRKKQYNAPLDPYNMFYIFRESSMSHILKMNQFTFTLYNYFKILL